jgi:hypothetical protein
MSKRCAVLAMGMLVLAAAGARAGSGGDCSCPSPSWFSPGCGGPAPVGKSAPCCPTQQGACVGAPCRSHDGCACRTTWDHRLALFCSRSEKLRDWLTYCPEHRTACFGCCSCRCAEYQPPLYQFFLDTCHGCGDYALAPIGPGEPPGCSSCRPPLVPWWHPAGCASCGGWQAGGQH